VTCLRCGQGTPRLTADQIHCPRCERELEALYAPQTAPRWLPTWRRAAIAKSLSGLPT
jgi:predicted amidophosphoribosyltransferase